MSTTSELLGLLDKIPAWKRINEVPARIDTLEKRLADLEKKMAGGGDICPRCKQPTFALIESKPDDTFGELGFQKRTYKCEACGFSEKKLIE